MRNTLMITASVAALLAAGGLACAQGTNEHREQPAAAAPEQKAPEGKADRQKLDAPQKSEAVKPAPVAQAPEGKTDPKLSAPQKSESVKPAPVAQAPEGKTDPKLAAPQKTESEKPAPTAQLPQKPAGAKAESVGQGGGIGMQPAQRNAEKPGEGTAPNTVRAESTPAAAALSPEHRTAIRNTIRSEKVAPLTGVQFSITIGEAIPRTVHLNRLPLQIVEYAPQYRGYEYILVGEDILIVDPVTLRIVAVISA
jgi:Protein of unknown function (DUF1236)